MRSKSNSIDMVEGPLWGKILKFSVLFIMAAVLQELYSAADVMVVGRFAGEKALAGVGTCTVLVNFLLNFILGFSAGVTIVLGQAIGESRGKVGNTVHTAMAIAMCGGTIVTTVCLVFTKQLLTVINVPQNVMPEAMAYLKIIAIGYIPSLTYNFGAGILRAKGDAKRPLYIVSISGLVNVCLNLLFVCVFKMGAAGVATATVVSHFFNAFVMLFILCHETDDTKVSLHKIRFYKEPLIKILKLGVPSGIQSSVYSLSNMLVQSSVNSFGSAAIAGSSASSSITSFYNVTLNGIYQSAMVFTSQNFGAKKFDRIKKIIFICITYLLALWAVQCVITYCFGEEMIRFFVSDDIEVVEMGIRKFSFLGYMYGFLGIMNIMCGILRGMGQSFLNMLISIIGVCGIRVIWILTAFKAIGTFESLFVCYPLSWFGTAVIQGVMVVITYKTQKKKLTNDKMIEIE